MIVDSNTTAADIEENSKQTVNQILDTNMIYLVETHMIPEIKSVARAANVPAVPTVKLKLSITGTMFPFLSMNCFDTFINESIVLFIK